MKYFAAQRDRFIYPPLFVAMVLALSACGGGSGDSGGQSRNINQTGVNQPAPLDNPQDAAKATLAFGSIVIPAAGLATALGALSDFTVPAGKTTKCKKGGKIQGKAGGVQHVHKCQGRSNTSPVVFDGVINLHCMNKSGGYCVQSKPHFGAKDGTAFLFITTNPQFFGGPFRALLKGDAIQTVTLDSSGDLSEIEAVLNEGIGVTTKSGANVGVWANNLHFDSRISGGSVETDKVGGQFGVPKSAKNHNCMVGTLTITTKKRIQINTAKESIPSSGEILLENSEGQKAHITFKGDSIKVRMNGGSKTTTIKEKALDKYCSVG